MVTSIGTNVQYQDNVIKFEVMILEDLPSDEFYGQRLKVWVHGFIRPEAYFPDFASFLQAMENDIFVAKQNLYELLINKRQAL